MQNLRLKNGDVYHACETFSRHCQIARVHGRMLFAFRSCRLEILRRNTQEDFAKPIEKKKREEEKERERGELNETKKKRKIK